MNVDVEELGWAEVPLGELDLPKARLRLSASFGSGLAAVPGSGGEQVWAVGDRGPNLKLKDAEEIYGWMPPPQWRFKPGVKMMPRPDVGPTLALLRITGDRIALERTVRIRDASGKPVSGLPIPQSGHADCEPALGLDGGLMRPDPNGMDTEGVAVLGDGSFWVGDEYGPSLVHVAGDGTVIERLVPEGLALAGAGFPVRAGLPEIAAKRHLNRGFEAIAVTPSSQRLYLVFQSPLAHPGPEQHEHARHVRLWELDLDGNVAAQFLYELDDPATFLRDGRKGKVERSDIKVCEIVALGERELLVLERGSETSKIYRVAVDPALALGPEHLEIATRPTIEERSCAGEAMQSLSKELLFTSDDWPMVGADIEGMALLDARTLLIVSDNDFGCEDKKTRFYRLAFGEDLAPLAAVAPPQ